MITLSVEDFLWFVDEALAQALEAVHELGDERVNQRPGLPGGNSPFAIVTHVLGVVAWWGGHAIAGRHVERDRDSEFVATGSVAELVERIEAARAQLADDLATLDPTAPPRGVLEPEDAVLPLGRTQAGVALHIYEELAQHLGQLQLTRDVLLATRTDLDLWRAAHAFLGHLDPSVLAAVDGSPVRYRIGYLELDLRAIDGALLRVSYDAIDVDKHAHLEYHYAASDLLDDAARGFVDASGHVVDARFELWETLEHTVDWSRPGDDVHDWWSED